MTFGAVTAQLGALTAAYGENLSSERSVTSLEGSRAIATFSVQAPFKAAVTKIVVGWLETAGSGASIASPGRCSRVVQKRKVGAFFDCFRRSCLIRVVPLSFPAFLFFGHRGIQDFHHVFDGSLCMRVGRLRLEIRSSWIFQGVLGRCSEGCYTPCKRVARPLQVNQPPIESRADDFCSRSVVFERKALN